MSTVEKQLDQLVGISRHYGRDSNYVIAGGGNTSFKNSEYLWVKASGISLADISTGGFVRMSRKILSEIGIKEYSEDPVEREDQVKKDLARAVVSPENLRPSVETSLHDLMDYAFVVHTHPTAVNALMCAQDVEVITRKLFADDAIFVEYTDPGYTLFKKVREKVADYVSRTGGSPGIIFLQNHGVFVAADTPDRIREIYKIILDKIVIGASVELPSDEVVEAVPDALLEEISRYMEHRSMVTKGYESSLIRHFTHNREAFTHIERPFTPDIIVYCKSSYLFLGKETGTVEAIEQIENFKSNRGYYPKVILLQEGIMIICDENSRSVETTRDVFNDLMRISRFSENFGGPHFMTDDQIAFIDNWEVENYRRKIAKQ